MDKTVYRLSAESCEIEIPRGNALRYMGYHGYSPDETVLELLDICEKDLRACMKPRACYTFETVAFPQENEILLGDYSIISRNLQVNLQGCETAILFAATLGVDVDRQIARAGRISAARGVVTDALASAAAEAWCSLVNSRLPAGELFLHPRYSPGYGDVSLEHQAFFLRRLDAPRQAGITLTASGMMAPTKSITVVAGLGKTPVRCRHTGCAACERDDCPYRE